MSIGKKLRFEIFKRDAFTCQYCGRKPPEVVLNVDHVLAVARGGGDEPINLLTSCWDCNSGKSDRPVDQSALPLLNDSAEMRREKLEQVRALNEAILEEQAQRKIWRREVLRTWARKEGSESADGKEFFYPVAVRKATDVFLQRLAPAEIQDALEIAFDRFPPVLPESLGRQTERFKFFCGVCWRKIKQDSIYVR